jgi:hypothetical protein
MFPNEVNTLKLSTFLCINFPFYHPLFLMQYVAISAYDALTEIKTGHDTILKAFKK